MSTENTIRSMVVKDPVTYQETDKGEYTLMRCPECYELVPAWISCEECGWSRIRYREIEERSKNPTQTTLGDQ